MDKLFNKFPCRSKEITRIHQLLGKEDEPVPSSIFIYGPPAVGKTSVVESYLTAIRANFVIVNCTECYTHRFLFESILSRLLSNSDVRCDNFMDLTHKLKNGLALGHTKSSKNILVLDGVEALNLGEHYVYAFSLLQELTEIHSLCVILISHLLPDKFNVNYPFIKIPFPQYTKDEILQILCLDRPREYSKTFYKNYLNAALSVFLRSTRDVNEMKFLVSSCFTKYCEPINEGIVQLDDVTSLWRHVAPHFKSALNSVYLGTSPRMDDPVESENYSTELVSNKALVAFDLPFYAKYFLIAAYLASYNSPKHDKRLYVKHHGKQRKKLTKKQIKSKLASDLLGPKAFSLDRLLAIFYAIMEDKASLTANLMVQISTLVELRLLTKLGDGYLEKPKFKCFVGFQCVDTVGRTLGFNLRKYLMD